MAKFIVHYKNPDGTSVTKEYTDIVADRIERILKGEDILPNSAIEALLKMKGGSSSGGGSGSGSGSGSGGNENQNFFTDDEIEDIWNSVNP